MDKTQATQHILTRLRAGYEPAEITEELSRILKAPTEVTGRFIDQVVVSHPEAIPAPSQQAPLEEMPEWMEPLPIQKEFDVESTISSRSGTQNPNSDLPPGLQALLNEAVVSPQVPKESASIPEPPSISREQLPQQAKFEPRAVEAEYIDVEQSNKIDLESLSQEVLQKLKKQKRFNDVVEFVCHRTGWHWNKSQRFVARVKTKHHDELISGKNRVTIIVGVGIILVGLVMMLNGASVLSDYAKLAAFARTNPEALFAMSPQAIFFALMATVTGIGMIIGGGYGVGRTLTDR